MNVANVSLFTVSTIETDLETSYVKKSTVIPECHLVVALLALDEQCLRDDLHLVDGDLLRYHLRHAYRWISHWSRKLKIGIIPRFAYF